MLSRLKMKEVLVIIFVVFMIELIISGPTIIDIVYLVIMFAYYISFKFSKWYPSVSFCFGI